MALGVGEGEEAVEFSPDSNVSAVRSSSDRIALVRLAASSCATESPGRTGLPAWRPAVLTMTSPVLSALQSR